MGLSFQAQVQHTVCVCVFFFFWGGGCSGIVYDKNEELSGITTSEDDSGSSYSVISFHVEALRSNSLQLKFLFSVCLGGDGKPHPKY